MQNRPGIHKGIRQTMGDRGRIGIPKGTVHDRHKSPDNGGHVEKDYTNGLEKSEEVGRQGEVWKSGLSEQR